MSWLLSALLRLIAWLVLLIPGFIFSVAGLFQVGAQALLSVPTGQVWFGLHSGSLQLIQPAIERYLTPLLWDNIFAPLLQISPLWWLAIGFAMLILARIIRR